MTSRYPGAGSPGDTAGTGIGNGADDGAEAGVEDGVREGSGARAARAAAKPPPPRPAAAPPIPHQRGGGAGEEDWSASTRYMCAGARLDEGFARRVVHELRHERYRACAPSYGVDLDRVGTHAEQTLGDLRKRDLVVGGAFLASLLLAPVATVVYWFATAFLPGGAPQGSAAPRWARGRERPRDPAVLAVLRALAVQVLVLLAASWLTPLVPVWLNDVPVATFLLTLVLLVVCPWVFTWEQRGRAWRAVREQLTREAFGSAADGPPVDRDATGLPQSSVGGDANLVVYSGYRPFVGAGDEVTSWSFAMRLTPEGHEPGTGAEPPPVPFDTAGLVRRMADDLDALRAGAVSPMDRVPGLEVTEKVFVHGTELRQNTLFGEAVFWPGAAGHWPPEGRPADQLSSERIAAARGNIDGPVRHCLCAQVRSWGTDLVLSVFVQVAVSAATLYLQANTLVLTPVKQEYRVADSVARPEDPQDGGSTAPGLADALLHSRSVLQSAPAAAFSELRAPARRQRALQEQRAAMTDDRRYDFGARLSLRELASSHAFRDFFQRVDVNRIGKQIELQVLGTVAEFLAEHGLDLGDLTRHRNVILNQGIMMTGGSMSGSIAAGAGAAALSTAPAPQSAADPGEGGGAR
ncbi:hypothetical protein ACIP98_26500 [Streptomyces sp. NPDC088354]|uniref:hypothetical protein n=1 Tax=Streptomyces sp. NPDC088354 TaxID=3365856 RepID=UPI0037FC1690